jgi:hypothetical protein
MKTGLPRVSDGSAVTFRTRAVHYAAWHWRWLSYKPSKMWSIHPQAHFKMQKESRKTGNVCAMVKLVS